MRRDCRHLGSLALVTALIAAPAGAASMQQTGAGLLDACTRPIPDWIGYCHGYMQAAVDSLSSADGVCIPDGTTRASVAGAVTSHLMRNEGLLRRNALDAVRQAMSDEYACQ